MGVVREDLSSTFAPKASFFPPRLLGRQAAGLTVHVELPVASPKDDTEEMQTEGYHFGIVVVSSWRCQVSALFMRRGIHRCQLNATVDANNRKSARDADLTSKVEYGGSSTSMEWNLLGACQWRSQ